MDSDNLEVEITEDMILTGDLERENIERLQGNLNPRVLKLASIVRTEANAPEILPYEEKLLDGITEAIRNQKEQIESINTTSGSKFTIEMYKMDLDRVQYMVKKYYRTRVLKIEKQLEAIMSDISYQDCLSYKEKVFAEKLHQLNKTYFEETVHRRLGEIIREEFERVDDFHRHSQPKMDEFVFTRALRDCPGVDVGGRGNEKEFRDYYKGDIGIVKYLRIEKFLKEGSFELI